MTAREDALGRKVAIVGFWEGNRNGAPFGDSSFEIFGLNHLWPYIPRWDRWLDIHTPEWSGKNMKPEVWADHEGWLRKDHGKPVYMVQHYDAYPSSVAYPKAEVSMRFRKYFTNGLAYMLGLLLLEHVNGQTIQRLEVWGADMRHSEEYQIQRPCFEFWLGVAQGLGIDVYVPPSSALLSADFDYGYEEQGGLISEALKAHREIVMKATARRDALLAEAQTVDGMIQDNQEWLRRWDQRSRGGIL